VSSALLIRAAYICWSTLIKIASCDKRHDNKDGSKKNGDRIPH